MTIIDLRLLEVRVATIFARDECPIDSGWNMVSIAENMRLIEWLVCLGLKIAITSSLVDREVASDVTTALANTRQKNACD